MSLPKAVLPRQTKAFTLIEILIVVAVIAVLAAIAVPNFLEAQTRAKVSRAKADMSTLEKATVSYGLDHKYSYPFMRNDFYQGASAGAPLGRHERLVPLTTPVAYIGTIPHDPFAKAIEGDAASAPPNDVYVYWDEETTKKYRDANGYFYAPSLMQAFGSQASKRADGVLFMSAGPDKRHDISETTLPPKASGGNTPPQQNVALPADYDATNGTSSAGQIYLPGALGSEE